MMLRSDGFRTLFRPALLAALFTLLPTPAPLAAQAPAAPDGVRAVLVTGANSGLGLRMTEVLSANGFFVYAGARSADDLRRLDAMENVKSVRLDVTVQEEIDAAAEFVRSEGRGLYGLVNNAGVAVVGPLIEMPEEEMNFQLDVNLVGPYRVTKTFAPLLIESRGRIMNTSSISGFLSGFFMGAYSMSKHGVEAFTDALAVEVEMFGISVGAVQPGNFRSEIGSSARGRLEAAGYMDESSLYRERLDALLSSPADRSQYPESDAVAEAVLDFMTSNSPARRYLVVGDQYEAEITIAKVIEELVQLNGDHPFSYNREELIRMLDEALARKP